MGGSQPGIAAAECGVLVGLVGLGAVASGIGDGIALKEDHLVGRNKGLLGKGGCRWCGGGRGLLGVGEARAAEERERGF